MSRYTAELSGRFPWTKDLVLAARRYTREGTEENRGALAAAQKACASDSMALQVRLGFGFVSDGGAWTADAFSPYVSGVDGVASQGNIDKYPGTRNSYYHTPIIVGKVKRRSPLGERVPLPPFPPGVRKMAVLPSPAAFALASEVSHYSSVRDLVADFAEVLRGDVEDLSRAGYEYVQLNEGFLPNPRFAVRGEGLIGALKDSIPTIFEGFAGRRGLYFHSGDASKLLPRFRNAGLTDIGFDYNTPVGILREIGFEENLVLGLQNATRKLPDSLLANEAEVLSVRVRAASKLARGDKPLTVCPSQDFDGLQTHAQAVRRAENLAGGVKLAEAAA